jgi:DNA-binding MarR family transcriptional regulator
VSPDKKKAVQLLLWSLKPFAALRMMPLNYMLAFLLVTLEEGQTPSTYARALGVNRWRMLHYLYELSSADKPHHRSGAGLGLVAVEIDPKNASRRKVVLTDKGRALVAKIIAPAKKDEKFALPVTKIDVSRPEALRVADMVLDGLKAVGQEGASSQLIREHIERVHGREINRTTVSSTLTGLLQEGLARRKGFIWFAASEARPQAHHG